MKTITTRHPDIGYVANVDIIARALREQFGFNDASHVLTAVAAHIWSSVCGSSVSAEIRWGSGEIHAALNCLRTRVAAMEDALGAIEPSLAPLRLDAVVRQTKCGRTLGHTDIALLPRGTADSETPLAVLDGDKAAETACAILQSFDGFRRTLMPSR